MKALKTKDRKSRNPPPEKKTPKKGDNKSSKDLTVKDFLLKAKDSVGTHDASIGFSFSDDDEDTFEDSNEDIEEVNALELKSAFGLKARSGSRSRSRSSSTKRLHVSPEADNENKKQKTLNSSTPALRKQVVTAVKQN